MSQVQSRWDRLFGKRFQDAAQLINVDRSPFKMLGWIGGSELATSNTENQFLSINDRIVHDKSISHAIRMSFGGTIPSGRFPAYGLALWIPLELIDVNVHPRKLEVRIKNIRELHDVTYAELRHILFGDSDKPSIYAANKFVHYPAKGLPSIDKPVAYDEYGRPSLVIGGQFFILLGEEEAHVIDLKRAWKSLLQLRLTSNETIKSKPLLMPQRLEASEKETLHLVKDEIEKYGFRFSDLGLAGEVLREVPVACPGFSPAVFLSNLCMLSLAKEDLIESISSAVSAAIDYGTFDKPNVKIFQDLIISATLLSYDWTCFVFDLDVTALTKVYESDL